MLNWFRRKRAARTLDQLIFDIAEHQRPDDYEEFDSILPSQKFYAPVQPSLAEMRGKRFLLFFTSNNDADLGGSFVEIGGDEVLRTALRTPHADGAVFQNARDSWIALERTKLAAIAQRAGIVESVVVPPDHKVVTFSPSAKPSLFRAESGYWILQCGDGADPLAAIESMERFVANTESANVIWIIDARFLQSIDASAFVRRATQIPRANVAHTAVFTPACDPSIMRAFAEAGFGVHLSGPDDVCFVEVHRPDGIVVGMPGPRFQTSATALPPQ